VKAHIDWDEAIEKDELTSVEVEVETSRPTMRYAAKSKCGTRLVLTGLTTRWNEHEFGRLAREIWALKPPFALPEDDPNSFDIAVESSYGDVVAAFDEQMRAIFDIWQARITAKLVA
jgi:hypothetical protein